jgi:long-subunit fatty acid transport protein
MKFGLMYKLNNRLKFSFAYHSPTWWEIEESTKESLKTSALDVDDLDGDSDVTEVNSFDLSPDVTNVYGAYKYISPGKWQAGISYTFGKMGFVAIDYGQKNWMMTRFVGGDYVTEEYFDYLNEQIANTFSISHQIRIGGELKLQEWALRAGYHLQTSPFRQTDKGKSSGLGFGIGYDFGNLELDFALHYANQTYSEQLFPVGLTQKYDVHTFSNSYMLTLRYNF